MLPRRGAGAGRGGAAAGAAPPLGPDEWRQLLGDFRWSPTARGRWLGGYSWDVLRAQLLTALRAPSVPLGLKCSLLVFLEENSAALLGGEMGDSPDGGAPRSDDELFSEVCRHLGDLIDTPADARSCPEEAALKAQALSTTVVLMVTRRVMENNPPLLESFVQLLLSLALPPSGNSPGWGSPALVSSPSATVMPVVGSAERPSDSAGSTPRASPTLRSLGRLSPWGSARAGASPKAASGSDRTLPAAALNPGVRAAACECLSELEVCYPGLLRPVLPFLTRAAFSERSFACQSYLLLAARVLAGCCAEALQAGNISDSQGGKIPYDGAPCTPGVDEVGEGLSAGLPASLGVSSPIGSEGGAGSVYILPEHFSGLSEAEGGGLSESSRRGAQLRGELLRRRGEYLEVLLELFGMLKLLTPHGAAELMESLLPAVELLVQNTSSLKAPILGLRLSSDPTCVAALARVAARVPGLLGGDDWVRVSQHLISLAVEVPLSDEQKSAVLSLLFDLVTIGPERLRMAENVLRSWRSLCPHPFCTYEGTVKQMRLLALCLSRLEGPGGALELSGILGVDLDVLLDKALGSLMLLKKMEGDSEKWRRTVFSGLSPLLHVSQLQDLVFCRFTDLMFQFPSFCTEYVGLLKILEFERKDELVMNAFKSFGGRIIRFCEAMNHPEAGSGIEAFTSDTNFCIFDFFLFLEAYLESPSTDPAAMVSALILNVRGLGSRPLKAELGVRVVYAAAKRAKRGPTASLSDTQRLRLISLTFANELLARTSDEDLSGQLVAVVSWLYDGWTDPRVPEMLLEIHAQQEAPPAAAAQKGRSRSGALSIGRRGTAETPPFLVRAGEDGEDNVTGIVISQDLFPPCHGAFEDYIEEVTENLLNNALLVLQQSGIVPIDLKREIVARYFETTAGKWCSDVFLPCHAVFSSRDGEDTAKDGAFGIDFSFELRGQGSLRIMDVPVIPFLPCCDSSGDERCDSSGGDPRTPNLTMQLNVDKPLPLWLHPSVSFTTLDGGFTEGFCPPFKIRLRDLFLWFRPGNIEPEAMSIFWEALWEYFSASWENAERNGSGVSGGAVCSAKLLHIPRELALERVYQAFGPGIVSGHGQEDGTSGNERSSAISLRALVLLPPQYHLLLRFAVMENSTVVHLACDFPDAMLHLDEALEELLLGQADEETEAERQHSPIPAE